LARKGLIIVYTGDGKGKTTAALGLAFRALGHNLPICVIQFIKGTWKYGELTTAKRFEGLLEFHVVGKGFTWKSKDPDADRQAAVNGWTLAKSLIAEGRHHLIVLDEFTYPIKYGMVDETEVLDTLRGKPESLHVLITGRNASPALIEAADLVTEMGEVKHPLKAGIKAQKGIEF
jgi:cob(I)alamin adenosyltransferase